MEILKDVLLKDFAWWKIGGPADHFCQPTAVSEVKEALDFAQKNQLKVTVLGGGTNVLVSDQGVEGLVICMRKLVGTSVQEVNGRLVITALAGTPKGELTKIFIKRKMVPALFLCGLPGDVGGGVVMNAGVSEKILPHEFNEIVDWVEVMDPSTGIVKRLTRDQIQWTYRHSEGWQPGVVVKVQVSWPLEVDEELPRKVKDATKNRLARQPLELPSCGSTFKNPPGNSAGALIEKAGLKGYQVGGAQVSPKHANFIVNLGGAKASDVRQIIAHVQAEVLRQFQVSLQTEVKFLGR